MGKNPRTHFDLTVFSGLQAGMWPGENGTAKWLRQRGEWSQAVQVHTPRKETHKLQISHLADSWHKPIFSGNINGGVTAAL